MFAEHKIESWLNSFLFIIIISFQAHLPEIKVHAYFAPVTPPPSVHGGGQRLCRCCIILWQWRARGGHLCLQVLLLWSGLKWVGAGHQGRCRREEGLDPLTAPDLWLIHRLIATGPWSVEPAPPLSSSSQSRSSPGPDVEDGWGKQSWMELCSLSVSLFLSRYKDKDLRSAPWHLDSLWWAGGRLNSRATIHHVLTNKQKNTLSSWTLSVEYHLNQTRDSSVWPSFFLLCPLNGSMEREKSWITENADFLSTNSKTTAWPACEGEFRVTGSTKWDMRRHLCIWKCCDFASVSCRNFHHGKDLDGNSVKKSKPTKVCLFSVLIVIVHVCLFTEGDLLCCGFEIKKWICCWNMDL